MLILVQVVAVVAVVHLRRRAAARANGSANGGWSPLNTDAAASDEDDEDEYGGSAVPEMEGMGGLPSYDDSEKVYAPPSYVVATPVGVDAGSHPPATPGPPPPHRMVGAPGSSDESRV